MPRPLQRSPTALTPGQAQFVLDRLIADRRISPGEIARYTADLQREIADLEARIAHLRVLSGDTRSTAPTSRGTQAVASPRKGRKRRTGRGNPLAGSYMGYMRQVKSATKKAEFKKIKEERGFADAITALKQHLGK